MKTSCNQLWCSSYVAHILPNLHTGQCFSQVQLLPDEMLSPYCWKYLLKSQQSPMQRKIYSFLLDLLMASTWMAVKLNTKFLFLMKLLLKNGLNGMIKQICFWVCVGNMATEFHWNSSLRKSWTFSVMPLITAISMLPVRYILQVLKVGIIFMPFLFQATVGAFCTLSENAWEAAVHIDIISGTYKKETGVGHTQLIQMVLQAGKKHQQVNGITYCTVSIASNSESKCGDALIEITMCWLLPPTSPIYTQLKPLIFLNLLVGEDDITADKDFEHIFKQQCNLMLQNKGFFIEGFCITPLILHGQLQANGVPLH